MNKLYNFKTKKWVKPKKAKKRKISLDKWHETKLPRALTLTEQEIYERGVREGHDKGFNDGLLCGKAEGRKEILAASQMERVKAATQLVSVVGQSFQSIANVLHEDGVVHKLLRSDFK